MAVQCELCPKYCVISKGQSGECRIRVNLDDRLAAVTYSYPCAIHVDPIEKKPLFHFLPGTRILSLATAGCNLHCKNCQNWEISQANPESVEAFHLPPEDIGRMARSYNVPSVAYTYTEPLVYYEYSLDLSINARREGIKNVLVTAGYLNTEPLKKIYKYTDAANIDLKALSDSFYRDVCGGSLKPVLESLVLAKSMGVHVEVTNLVIPTLNDSEKDLKNLSSWIFANLGAETPLHFSRFYPQYRMQHLPPTSSETLLRARATAYEAGLHYVYLGNLPYTEGENTYCPGCKKILISRGGYQILLNNVEDGRCASCKKEIYGVWK